MPEGICLVEFSNRRMLETQLETLRKRFGRSILPGKSQHLEQLELELGQYFAGTLTNFKVPLTFPGSPFQERVWSALLRIPYGETRSYEDLACQVGIPVLVELSGRANGLNRIAILIPCHRVVNKGGKLGGYGGGLWRKQWLLELELLDGSSGKTNIPILNARPFHTKRPTPPPPPEPPTP